MPKRVLITGGSGLIGTQLTELLIRQGYEVAHVSRSGQASRPGITVYRWDLAKAELDDEAITTADYIVHLAGAGVADERWTESRKREILDSRVQSLGLLTDKLRNLPHRVQAFISSSAIGIYGADTGNTPLTEASPAGNDFLAEVTKQWEAAADLITRLGIRTVKLRTGIVLSNRGGALEKMAQPIRLGAGAPLGSGKQYVSWLHIEDMARMYQYAIEQPGMQGVYNAVAPGPVTNEQLTRLIADVLHKPLWLPHVPAFALRLALGEMASAVLGGNRVINQRLARETDFQYQFADLKTALEDLLTQK